MNSLKRALVTLCMLSVYKFSWAIPDPLLMQRLNNYEMERQHPAFQHYCHRITIQFDTHIEIPADILPARNQRRRQLQLYITQRDCETLNRFDKCVNGMLVLQSLGLLTNQDIIDLLKILIFIARHYADKRIVTTDNIPTVNVTMDDIIRLMKEVAVYPRIIRITNDREFPIQLSWNPIYGYLFLGGFMLAGLVQSQSLSITSIETEFGKEMRQECEYFISNWLWVYSK